MYLKTFWIHRTSISCRALPNITDGDFEIIERDKFYVGKKSRLRWCGQHLIVKADKTYNCNVVDLEKGSVDDIQISQLKFYSYDSSDADMFISHVRKSQTEMAV